MWFKKKNEYGNVANRLIKKFIKTFIKKNIKEQNTLNLNDYVRNTFLKCKYKTICVFKDGAFIADYRYVDKRYKDVQLILFIFDSYDEELLKDINNYRCECTNFYKIHFTIKQENEVFMDSL